jgi:hypothetical protein
MTTEEFLGVTAVILFLWSAILIWATWQLQKLARELDTEREELHRWKRLHALNQRQNTQWQ